MIVDLVLAIVSSSEISLGDFKPSDPEEPSTDKIGSKTDVFFEDTLKQLIPNLTIGSDSVPLDADFAWLVFLLLLSLVWLTFALYYYSRLLGYVLTKVVNNVILPRYFYTDVKRHEQPYFKVSSFSITLIAGKIMFRDLVWITPDYSVRTQDGWIIFRWWKPFHKKDIRKTDFSHADARISISFNGFEHHIYNRSKLYSELEKIFGIDPSIFGNSKFQGKDPPSSTSDGNLSGEERGGDEESQSVEIKKTEQLISAYLWRNFFPLTKIEILAGRFVFGNHLLPTTLLITFEEGHITYTSRPAVSPNDLFTHIGKAKAESFKVILAPSPKYTGIVEEPPRFMGEGFVVFQTNFIDLYYYQDEPGIESSEPEKIELPTGDIVQRFTSPAWGLDIKCGKGTHFGYGPWADRNRDSLYNFFYSSNYQIVKADQRPPPGQIRRFETFYIRLSTLTDAAIDMLFINKEKETKAFHVNAGPGSYLEVSLPWTSSENGYQTHIVGQILHLDATTNLNFRSLAESETLEFKVDILYPRVWNDHQIWNCSITGCKATVDLIYAHKTFFHDLIEDWAIKDRPDLMQFIPYTWKFNILLKEFELITLANEHNWIDCSSKLRSENAQLAICGDIFDMSFDLPFNEFLPLSTAIKIWIQGESLTAAIHLPECNLHRDNIFMLDKYAVLCPPLLNSSLHDLKFTAMKTSDLFDGDKKWRRCASRENGWLDCWTVPIVALSISYTYYPVPPKAYSPKPSEITTPEREELLLEPIRPEKLASSEVRNQIPPDFNPGSIEPDLIELELEVGPSKICLYGALFRLLWNIKENYVGECQEFTDFNSNPNVAEVGENKGKLSFSTMNPRPFDSRLYRPLAVTISVTLHDTQGHIMKSCEESSDLSEASPCPYLYLERLTFEMNKRYSETKMQLLLSPLIMDIAEYTFIHGKRSIAASGHVIMDALQFRGHAMFSGLDRPLESETLEYSWLVEVHVGDITGKLTPSQLLQVLIGLETFFVQVAQEDCSLQPPSPYRKCLHDNVQSLCPKTQESSDKMCPYSEDLKYRMVRVDINGLKIYLVEKNSVIGVELEDVKLCTCNLHSCHTSSGLTALIKETTIHHFMKTSNLLSNFRSSKIHLTNHHGENSTDNTFYEVAKVNFGTVFIDSVELFTVDNKFTVNQDTFLRQHDENTKRLWFLWPEKAKEHNCIEKCGCVGGCVFFGNNSYGINFFSIEKPKTSSLPILGGQSIVWGESLLKPGEPVPGFTLHTIIGEEEENEDNRELAPLVDRNSLRLASPISPSGHPWSAVTTKDSTSQNIPSLISSHSQRNTRASLFNRQISSPAAQSFYFSKPDNLSPDNSSVPDKRKLSCGVTSRNRSLSENDEIGMKINTFSEDTKDKNGKNSNGSNPTGPSNKTSASYKTAAENPFIVTSGSFPSSLRDTDDVFVTAASSDHVQHVLSDDTFKSVQSITASTVPNFDSASLSHDALNKSRASIQSTYSAPAGKPRDRDTLEVTDSEADNRSISSSSFISAVSSQENDLNAMVDLRNQMEKPIIESPLLMSSYMDYLTRFKCENFRTSTSRNILSFKARRKVIPKFNRTSVDGLSLVRLIDKKPFNATSMGEAMPSKAQEKANDEDSTSFAPGCVYLKIDGGMNEDHTKGEKNSDDNLRHENSRQDRQKEFSKTVDIRHEKLTILLRLNGEASIRVSPLCFDGLKTLLTGLVDSFATLHPLTVLNHLNAKCFSQVARKNQLKKGKALEYGQLKHKVWKSTLERENLAKNQQIATSRTKFGEAFQDMKSQFKGTSAESTITVSQCEENRKSEFQAFVQISNINLIVLQASLVEEFITFSALDDTKDLTCVSMFSVNLSRLNFDCYSGIQERRSLHTIISNNIRNQPTSAFAQFAQSDIVSRLFFRKPKKERAEVEPVTIENDEIIEEEMVGCGGIGTLHVQLTRLKNNSNILKDAILTVVPQNESKVNFYHEKVHVPEQIRQTSNSAGRRRSSGSNRVLKRQDGVEGKDYEAVGDESKETIEGENNLYSGFIMFECGLEGISLKAIKKHESSEVSNDEAAKKPAATVQTDGVDRDQSDKKDKKPRKEKENGNASSFVGEIDVIWFNFAAPPKTPNTRKIDFTRLDWHFLSTATPSINAWMSVGDRFITTLKEVTSLYEQRVASIVTYLMISGLEVKGIHIPPESKCYIRKMTPFSKAQQEDPSCQLMNVLRRYLNENTSIKEVEANLRANVVPPLLVLKRGVVAASRQWKNALYMPLLVEQNIRQNRGGRDTSSIYQSGIPLRLLFETSANKKREEPEVKPSPENFDMDASDEKTNLLPKASPLKESKKSFYLSEGRKEHSSQPEIVITSGAQSPANEEVALTTNKRKTSTLPNIFSRSSRGSLAYPLLTYPLESLGSGVNRAYEFFFSQNSHLNSGNRNKCEESQLSLKPLSNSSSSDEANVTTDQILTQKPADGVSYHEENLYIWMSRQQDYMEAKNLYSTTNRPTSHLNPRNIDIEQARHNTLGSANSNDEEALQKSDPLFEVPPGFVFVPTGVQMNNVLTIFQPLFLSLGIENLNEEGEPVISFDQLGPKITLSVLMRMLKVNIIESDAFDSASPRSRSPVASISSFDHPKNNFLKPDYPSSPLRWNNRSETAAFICDKLELNLDLRKVRDSKPPENVETSNANKEDISEETEIKCEEEEMPILIVGPDGGINEITTMINFNVDVHHIIQRVNLPLLRLLHQVASMYESIKETRCELRANRLENQKTIPKTTIDPAPIDVDFNLEHLSVTPSLTSISREKNKVLEEEARETIINIPNNTAGDSFEIASIGSIGRSSVTEVPEVVLRPKCWKTMYYLIDLYETTPETKTITERIDKTSSINQNALETKITIDEDEDNRNRGKGGYEQLRDNFSDVDDQSTPTTGGRKISFEGGIIGGAQRKSMMNIVSSDKLKTYTQALIHRELTPLVVFGVTKIEKVNLTAMLGGLKLDGELNSFHFSLNHKGKVRGAALQFKKWKESSLTGHLGQSNFSLFEEVPVLASAPTSQQMVVKMVIGKSQTLISSQNKKGKDANSVLLTIGAIVIDIPQHPVALHGMMTRSSKQLSTTLQELRSSRQPSRSSYQQTEADAMAFSFPSNMGASYYGPAQISSPSRNTPLNKDHFLGHPSGVTALRSEAQKLIKPILFQFSVVFDSFTIGASLLPSLRSQYQIGQITSSGIMGTKAKFVVDVRVHTLSFNTNLSVSDSNLPSSAKVLMPPIHVSAEYMEDNPANRNKLSGNNRPESFTEGIVLRKGSYLNAIADIGAFEHTLTTDLLNHLLLVQKVFMKEVNEVVQKMSRYDSKAMDFDPNDLKSANTNGDSVSTKSNYLLFSLNLRMKGVQITATTPSNSAVRLETGAMELQLSNRVQNMSSNFRGSQEVSLKLFIKLHVDLNVALGQLIRDAMFDEADPEFQQLAYFKTRIVLRNALQDEMIPSSSAIEGKEALLITLNRPLVYVQPLALDKAVLVWLNYKNAYEYWNEQRANLSNEVLSATQQVMDKVHQVPQVSSQNLGTLFLQLTIDDLGICLPISYQCPGFYGNKSYDTELRSALVVTLENTKISACSCGSLVSKGRFNGLCFRFVDDFETSLDDWKPDTSSIVLNKCKVSEGTYEICSKTITHVNSNHFGSDAKWLLNVSWKMDGFDIHVDTSIGKQLSALFKTLTAIAGDEDETDTFDYSSVGDETPNVDVSENPTETKPNISIDSEFNKVNLRRLSLFKDGTSDTRKRSRLIEKELNEQAKIINDLRQLGASQSTIEQEIKRLHELESAVFNDFKRDVIKKLRRQSMKKSFREKPKYTGNKLDQYIKEDKPSEPNSEDTSPKDLFSSNKPLDHPSFDVKRNYDTPLTSSLIESRSAIHSSPTAKMSLSYPPASTKDAGQISLTLLTSTDSSSSNNSHPTPSSSFSNYRWPVITSSSSSTQAETSGHDVSAKKSDISSTSSNSASESKGNPLHYAPIETNLKESKDRQTSPEQTPHARSIHSLQDPYIDFELDVKVFFKSGQCVFHTRDPNKERDDEYARKNGFPKERSFTGNLDGLSSPASQIPRYGPLRSSMTNNKASQNSKTNFSYSRLRYPATAGQSPNLQTEFSSFSIPGLDVKVHYNSKTVYTSSSQFNASESMARPTSEHKDSENSMNTQSSILGKKIGTKKASCYAWMTLHKIARETLITPHILDFMEQALEPIPKPLQAPPKIASPVAPDNPPVNPTDSSRPDLITSAPAQYAVYGSFPVDVIVYLHMQPSALRFSCLPVSRVECLLQLPSVDFVISSKRSQDELNLDPPSLFYPKSSSQGPTRASDIKFSHRRSASDYRHPQHQAETSIGGLSMTGCLADFSLYIFHPYGGHKKTTSSSSLSSSTSAPNSKSNSDRKDSLSLQVEFVKVNISRSRRLVLSLETSPLTKSSQQSSHASQEKLNSTVVIRFSALCDIGSASFKYDMRRLTEILAFPKAWYRKAIWKRMFLGEQSLGTQNVFSDHEYNLSSSSSAESLDGNLISSKEKCLSTGNVRTSIGSVSKAQEDRKSLWLNLNDLEYYQKSGERLRNRNLIASFSSGGTFQQQRQIMNAPWKTLILFGVNLCKLNVHMNMGNVMGNTSWLTRGFRSEGRISIDSSGCKSVNISLGLDGSSLDAKGGIVGGVFEINHIQTRVGIKENTGKEPEHVVTLQLGALEKRLDYMSTSILMLRISDLDLTLRDEWIIDNQLVGSNHPTRRPACIFIHCNLNWDQLQLLMSKSTTPDIIKIISKLEEFFSQQFHSSKRVFSALQPLSSSAKSSLNRHSFRDRRERGSTGSKGKPSTPVSSSTSALPESGSEGSGSSIGMTNVPLMSENILIDARHHRHWQKVLKLVSGASLSTLSSLLPLKGTILGGTFELNGNNISLACFYGINFRSKSWALFSLRQPSISFASEAQDVINNETGISDTHIVQNFSFSLGRQGRRREMDEKPFSVDCFYAQHSNMATVCKISRTFTFPPQFKTMHEWFQYTFADSELDQINRFPVIEFEISGDGFGSAASSIPSRRILNPKTGEYHHSKEVIFALPSLQMDLKTEHLQRGRPPTLNEPKPTVFCTFVTDFDAHIFVAVDAEAYFFLHDLIQSYIKEKQSDLNRTSSGVNQDSGDFKVSLDSNTHQSGGNFSRQSDLGADQESQITQHERDWREFNCQTWHLEPTVRLVTWGGKSIEPYGVDYILQRLGFMQARTTIPKWIQRGAMDPLDKILSAIMHRIVSAAKNEPSASLDDK